MKKYKVTVYDHDSETFWADEYLAYTVEELRDRMNEMIDLHEEVLLIEEVK